MAVRATITFVKPHASVAYVSASAADFKIVPESEYKFHYETLTLSELVGFVLNKPLSDGITTSDFAIVDMTKGLADSFAFSDSFNRSVIYNRSFSDAFTLDDIAQVDKHIGANKGNITSLSDLLTYGISKATTDSMTFSDVLAHVVAKVIADSFSFTDTTAIENQKVVTDSYSFTDSQNYSLAKPLSDSFGYTDAQALSHQKSFTDAFALDDAALVNKNYIGTKGNVFSFTDTFSFTRTHGKALGNMKIGTQTLN